MWSRKQQGLTLIEVLVAIAAGLLVLTAAVAAVVAMRDLSKKATQKEDYLDLAVTLAEMDSHLKNSSFFKQQFGIPPVFIQENMIATIAAAKGAAQISPEQMEEYKGYFLCSDSYGDFALYKGPECEKIAGQELDQLQNCYVLGGEGFVPVVRLRLEGEHLFVLKGFSERKLACEVEEFSFALYDDEGNPVSDPAAASFVYMRIKFKDGFNVETTMGMK